ncbi:HpcH/HpaI aldolase family protein [Paracoccus methylarcula]|nr:aldolase/citrate lyase family protein [Paracoccus methylarcula]
MLDKYAFWMSTPNLDFLEIAVNAGFRRVILDIEHNSFTPDRREALVVAARAMGVMVCAKIEAPESVWVQRAVDLGVDAVILPHVERLRDVHAALSTTKFPPQGTRSYAAGRSAGFAAPDNDYFARQNREILCLPMIETAAAFDDLDAILASPLVDGLFVGPFDLALSRGRDNYLFQAADRADIAYIATRARAAGKPWWMPAWGPAEQVFARENGAMVQIVGAEHQVLAAGMATVISGIATGRAKADAP